MIARLASARETVLIAVLGVLAIVLSQFSDQFFTLGNLLGTSRFFVEIGLISLGMTLVIITAGIDLSVGAALALVSVTIGFGWQWGLPLPVAVLAGLAVGAAAGYFNGFMVTRLDLHPLVVTLGTLSLYRGLALGLSEADAVSGYPSWFAYIGQYYLGPVPGQLIVFVVAVAAVWLLLARTPFGRYVYAIGSNEEAARFSGVPVRRTKVILYTLTGALVGLAALIFTSRVSTTRADFGQGLELDVIAAVVLGGTSIYGGTGTIPGTVLGVVIIATLRNGMQLAGVATTWQLLVLGILLIVSVFFNEFFRRRRE